MAALSSSVRSLEISFRICTVCENSLGTDGRHTQGCLAAETMRVMRMSARSTSLLESVYEQQHHTAYSSAGDVAEKRRTVTSCSSSEDRCNSLSKGHGQADATHTKAGEEVSA